MSPPEQSAQSVRGVVVAGGDSTRFEAGDKALATVGSETMLNRILDVVDQTTHREPVIAVRTADQRSTYAEAVERPVQFVFDAADHEGPLAGLVGAARSLESRWLFCCGCDMPLLAPSAVRWMIRHPPHGQTNSPQQVDAIAVEGPTGVLDPLHTLYRRERIIEIQQTLPQRAGPRMLLSELEGVHTVSTAVVPADIPLKRSTTNVNTLDELERILPNRL